MISILKSPTNSLREMELWCDDSIITEIKDGFSDVVKSPIFMCEDAVLFVADDSDDGDKNFDLELPEPPPPIFSEFNTGVFDEMVIPEEEPLKTAENYTVNHTDHMNNSIHGNIFDHIKRDNRNMPTPAHEANAYSECKIFSHDPNTQVPGDLYNEEVLSVLFASFPFLVEHIEKISYSRCVETAMTYFSTLTNHDIVDITRIDSTLRTNLFYSYRQIYGIKDARIVFHGTSEENAMRICKQGFKCSLGQRAKFGFGVYTAKSAFEALSYATPDKHLNQTLLVTVLSQGPTTIGVRNLSDFGCDAMGKDILTVTNPEETIFCASDAAQLLVPYRIRVRYNYTSTLLPTHHENVQFYHAKIYEIIWGKHVTVPNSVRDMSSSDGITIGDSVIVQDLQDPCLVNCNNASATVKKITSSSVNGTTTVSFCIEFCQDELHHRVLTYNSRHQQAGKTSCYWLSCERKNLILSTNKRMKR